MKIRKAVIAAAGWGTRFLPLTKTMPKEMLPLLNKPIIQYSIEELAGAGIEMAVVITSQGKRAIEDYFDRSPDLEQMLAEKGMVEKSREVRDVCNMLDVCYVRQKEQLGLGHALLAARNMIGNEPFVLVLPDDLFEYGEQVLMRMMDIHRQYGGCVLASARVADKDVTRYGIIGPEELSNRVYRVKNLIEKPSLAEAPSNLAVMGRYILTPDIFEILMNTPPGRNQEIQLTDGLQRLLKRSPMFAYEAEGERYDAGSLAGWLDATFAMALKDPVIGPELKQSIMRRLQLDNAPAKTASKDQPVLPGILN